MPENENPFKILIQRAVGDNVVFSAAVRAINQATGRQIILASPWDEVWLHNPRIAEHLPAGKYKNDPSFTQIDYVSAITQSSSRPIHFTRGFLNSACSALKIEAPLKDLRPELFLTEAEQTIPPLGRETSSYWVMFPGGKTDMVTKLWDPTYWQRLVSILRFEKFVVVGSRHPMAITRQLRDVIDLTGKTSVRELIHLIYHSAGVVCGVTCGMHIAAAFNKPCVVLAGGREPWWWESYNPRTWNMSCNTPVAGDFKPHVFLHTIGEMECCKYTGCGRSKLHAGATDVCLDIVTGPSESLPKCMHSISTEEVAAAIRGYSKMPHLRTPKIANRMNAMRLPITVATLLYGGGKEEFSSKSHQKNMSYFDIHRRVVNSIMDCTAESLYELRIGCNAVGEETLAWLRDLAMTRPFIKLFIEPVNIGKEPLMRRMLANDQRDSLMVSNLSTQGLRRVLLEDQHSLMRDSHFVSRISQVWADSKLSLNTEWFFWLDDDVYLKRGDWLLAIDQLLISQHFDAIGYLFHWPVDVEQLRWISQATWYQYIPLRMIADGRPIISFHQGGFWGCRVDVMRRLNWPDPRLWHSDDDVLLGEALRQNGFVLYDLNNTAVKDMAVINDMPRRGMSQAPAGMSAQAYGRTRIDHLHVEPSQRAAGSQESVFMAV